ncbi:MAG: 3'-5' exonuclease [Candidatus Adiutrix sp.]
MQHFIDLHIHSHYSRATSKALTVDNLAFWAHLKGLSLIGTGDLTHPSWLKELKENLSPLDDGFYGRQNNLNACRFVPTGEISAIYKQDGRTRKIHLLVVAPTLEVAAKFSQTLGRLGNVLSDGRPILGLSSRNILEIALNVSPQMVIIPAHIWTPWFSLFGANSGFDQVEECFGDLSPHITALETGLSSDPSMNRLVSHLDNYALISSSDAHSPDKLGREATILNGPLTWDNLMGALKGSSALGGTVEFFPEEGKYYLDGHQKCGLRLTPAETKAQSGLCPVCGQAVTIGVLNRVWQLADRKTPKNDGLPAFHLVPLAEILGQIFQVNPKSKKVDFAFNKLISELGSEFNILLNTPLSDLETLGGPWLSLAIDKMRRGEVETQGGFDGQYGQISLIGPRGPQDFGQNFKAGDFGELLKQNVPQVKVKKVKVPVAPNLPEEIQQLAPLSLSPLDFLLDNLDENQRSAVTSQAEILAVTGPPGSGKTKVLIHRAAWLLRENIVDAHKMLIIAPTDKWAESLSFRLKGALPFRPESGAVRLSTLPALAYDLLKETAPSWDLAPQQFLEDLVKKAAKKAGLNPYVFARLLSLTKNNFEFLGAFKERAAFTTQFLGSDICGEKLWASFDYYNRKLQKQRLWDGDDLINEASPSLNNPLPFKAILIDEFQDLSAAQFAFIKRLRPPLALGHFLTVFSDPHLSPYSLGGHDLFEKFYPTCQHEFLEGNYRASRRLVKAASSLIGHFKKGHKWSKQKIKSPTTLGPPDKGAKVIRATLSTPKREASYIVSQIKAHLGTSKPKAVVPEMAALDFLPQLALKDIAVIFRTPCVALAVGSALDKEGLPWQMSGADPIKGCDHLDFTADKINLLTMHGAKGLDFRLTFVMGVEEGLLPYEGGKEGLWSSNLNEELRLFYVALTRAKECLYITRSVKRRVGGQLLSGEPSPFWGQIKAKYCLDISPKFKTPKPKKMVTLFD